MNNVDLSPNAGFQIQKPKGTSIKDQFEGLSTEITKEQPASNTDTSSSVNNTVDINYSGYINTPTIGISSLVTLGAIFYYAKTYRRANNQAQANDGVGPASSVLIMLTMAEDQLAVL